MSKNIANTVVKVNPFCLEMHLLLQICIDYPETKKPQILESKHIEHLF